MRTVDVAKIRDAVRDACLEANFVLRKDILRALRKAVPKETNRRAKGILKSIIENAGIAKAKRIAICQDTGMVTVFLEIGREVAFEGGNLATAINEGVTEAYLKGYLRKSVVDDPVLRRNTNTNTPAVIHTDIVEGDRVSISVMPKGFGSENKSKAKALNPTATIYDIKEFVLNVVREAGPDACPPLVLGIGIGGTFEKTAYLAKKAVLRPIGQHNPKKHIKKLEKDLQRDINALGIGPMGLGGKTTALGVNIETFPTHIAGLIVAVNVSCHATRGAERTL